MEKNENYYVHMKHLKNQTIKKKPTSTFRNSSSFQTFIVLEQYLGLQF